ncbi:class II aldolase and Adducin N-terminal domain-containing protein [Leptodontidium sp. 2 PMI_412]|nr:class II aldolase and Adducin N-terminal domain-containing protein [Leptodontidium sp. 2 PMI_412]
MSATGAFLPDSLGRKFISGCHILHYHGVLDAYGHLSVRHPMQPDIFIMARQIAPALVSGLEDLVQYRVSDASSVDPSITDGYVERHIHSEIFKKFPDVYAVIHSHAESVIPYGISGVPLQTCFHMAGFLGASTPVYDISALYNAGDKQDMLVRDTRLGKALADCFANSNSESRSGDHAVVMMRGHGMTVIAPSIEDCVLRAIYTQQNASIQTTVLMTRSGYRGSVPLPEVRFLNDGEAADSAVMTQWSSGRPWKLWVREIEQAGLYINNA